MEKLSQLPKELLDLARRIGMLAYERGWRAFLVGGVVRDLLLDRPFTEADIVVEGNALEIALKLPGKSAIHHRFGTATLYIKGYRLDLATARRETYPKPGALPIVEPGDILQDLFRRDFTINALAIEISPDAWGRIFDPYGGREDLDKKLIRVLHPKSFQEDATRILRALRYEQRLGFKLEDETKNLLLKDKDFLPTVGPDRLRNELELILKEEFPEKVFMRAGELNVMEKIFPALKGDGWLAKMFDKARKLFHRAELEKIYLCLLTYRLTKEEVEGFSCYFRFPKSTSHLLLSTQEIKERLDLLPSSHAPLYFFLKNFPPLSVQANRIASRGRASRLLEFYIDHLSKIKTEIRGDDLIRLGIPEGPAIGEILRRILWARLEGEVKSRGEEERLALSLMEKMGQKPTENPSKGGKKYQPLPPSG